VSECRSVEQCRGSAEAVSVQCQCSVGAVSGQCRGSVARADVSGQCRLTLVSETRSVEQCRGSVGARVGQCRGFLTVDLLGHPASSSVGVSECRSVGWVCQVGVRWVLDG
jgi:hypothetical protein